MLYELRAIHFHHSIVVTSAFNVYIVARCLYSSEVLQSQMLVMIFDIYIRVNATVKFRIEIVFLLHYKIHVRIFF